MRRWRCLFQRQASAYEVDCAILLCLSGGWPASAECNHARAVFIQRITPWPIEPPLQIWRCPMGAAMNIGPATTPSERVRDLAKFGAPMAVFPASLLVSSVRGEGAIEAVLTRDDGAPDAPDPLHRIVAEISEEEWYRRYRCVGAGIRLHSVHQSLECPALQPRKARPQRRVPGAIQYPARNIWRAG